MTIFVSTDQLRIFKNMADCLNLSETARRLQLSRQTVQRGIKDFEKIQGKNLFIVEGRQYHITSAGKALYPEVQEILRSIEQLSASNSLNVRRVEGLERAQYRSLDGEVFYSQQHTPCDLRDNSAPLLKGVLEGWGASLGQLSHDTMQILRPYVVLYRRTKTGWVFAEVGEMSGYARWFGVDFALSAMGMPFEEDGVSDSYNDFIKHAYNEVHDHGGVRLDHVYAKLRHPDDNKIRPLSFQRLLAGVSLDNGSRALLMASALTNQIQIDALQGKESELLPEDLVMNFNPLVRPQAVA